MKRKQKSWDRIPTMTNEKCRKVIVAHLDAHPPMVSGAEWQEALDWILHLYDSSDPLPGQEHAVILNGIRAKCCRERRHLETIYFYGKSCPMCRVVRRTDIVLLRLESAVRLIQEGIE